MKTQDKTTQVFLKSGKLTVEAIEGKFRRLVEKTEEEFEETIKKEEKEFDEFVKKEEREFEEFVKRFEMKSGQSIVIVGQEVKNIEFSKELDREFDLLEDW